ncbi:hypothetical protein B7W85_22110 [Allorhizobium ampelinum]|nr:MULTISPECIES: EAL domain-containing protein [Rhizobium/Agrobacterium group]MCF1436990.1 EAL domain-containing protein [Allorhizobium ampelinum]MCF1465082.1 EAL domain-containing protein [Allorhizobium ampelinum]MCF1496213.1 EAL domain-containing protein [Allorhizobium ampelinum]MUO92591.1 EAL domain-containing protein [Agrobacterium vitis]MUZ55677.1 EAL domain-containing protein [Agrobacterium vitis]
MSQDLGLQTIAEGIETPEQEAALRAMGCPAGQGYRYGRPMSEGDLALYIDDRGILHSGLRNRLEGE